MFLLTPVLSGRPTCWSPTCPGCCSRRRRQRRARWETQITWPGHLPLIGWEWSHDLDTCPWLVEEGGSQSGEKLTQLPSLCQHKHGNPILKQSPQACKMELENSDKGSSLLSSLSSVRCGWFSSNRMWIEGLICLIEFEAAIEKQTFNQYCQALVQVLSPKSQVSKTKSKSPKSKVSRERLTF